MGNFAIVIHGTGFHHNFEKEADGQTLKKDADGQYVQHPHDADKMSKAFVAALQSAGHTIESANITVGARYDLLP